MSINQMSTRVHSQYSAHACARKCLVFILPKELEDTSFIPEGVSLTCIHFLEIADM